MEAAKKENRAMKKMQRELKLLSEQSRLPEEQLELRTTALNVLKGVSEHMPEGVKLNHLSFDEKSGQRNNIVLRGEVKQEGRTKLQDYADQLAQATMKDPETSETKPLFDTVTAPNTDVAAGGFLNWNIVCILRRQEATQ